MKRRRGLMLVSGKNEKPLLAIQRTNSGSGSSGSDLLKAIGCQDVGVRPLPRDLNDKNPIVGVHVGLKVVPKLLRTPGGA